VLSGGSTYLAITTSLLVVQPRQDSDQCRWSGRQRCWLTGKVTFWYRGMCDKADSKGKANRIAPIIPYLAIRKMQTRYAVLTSRRALKCLPVKPGGPLSLCEVWPLFLVTRKYGFCKVSRLARECGNGSSSANAPMCYQLKVPTASLRLHHY
jgi:hypothetical protein